ncbi:hypothetical protein ACQY0O_007826 [Thecaphora frezii]
MSALGLTPSPLPLSGPSSASSAAYPASSRTLHTPRRTDTLVYPKLYPASTPISQLPRAVMSASLGRHARHSLDAKIAALAARRFSGIEIHFECLENEARRLHSLSPQAKPSHDQLYAAAREVRRKCDAAGLEVVCLEPFLHYPGLLPVARRDERLQEVPLWFALADILGTDLIQVASAMFGGPGVTDDEDRIVEDLTLLAELGLRWPRTKFWAYEAMCFGAYTTTWQQAWRHVELVDRANFGIVIDTFQVMGAAYADPTAHDGKTPDAEADAQRALQDLRDTFGGAHNRAKRQKVFLMQLGDARKMEPALDESSEIFDASQHANLKMCWARHHRLFAGEGYLPALDVARTLLVECGWRGYISAEYFNSDTFEDDAQFPEKAAERCSRGHEGFVEAMTEKEASPL